MTNMSEEVRGLASMSDESRDYFVRRLRSLKMGAGLTPERIGTSNIGGVLRWFGATTTASAYDLLRTALGSMNPDHLYVQALINAYGGEGFADDLKARRKSFARKHGLKESRVIKLEEAGLAEMIKNLDALARGEEIRPSRPEVVVSSVEESSTDEPTVKELLISLIEVTREQTAVQRETNELLKRLSAVWTA